MSVGDRWLRSVSIPPRRNSWESWSHCAPGVSHDRAAGALVYMVAALLAQITSSWRIGALGDGDSSGRAEEEALIAFCVAGG